MLSVILCVIYFCVLFILCFIYFMCLSYVFLGELKKKGSLTFTRPGATIRPTRRSPRAQGKGRRKNYQKTGAKLIKVRVGLHTFVPFAAPSNSRMVWGGGNIWPVVYFEKTSKGGGLLGGGNIKYFYNIKQINKRITLKYFSHQSRATWHLRISSLARVAELGGGGACRGQGFTSAPQAYMRDLKDRRNIGRGSEGRSRPPEADKSYMAFGGFHECFNDVNL